ncbi:MAG: MBL fold metallo-hydrolase [Myxococcales bacterium]|nr:MBL fold metallo-hydrolase [Myxococcales bacterium]
MSSPRTPAPARLGSLLALALALLALACRPILPAVEAPKPTRVKATPPPSLTLCWVESGRFGPATASALVIRHPAGDVLVDAGNSLNFLAEIEVYDPPERRRLRRLPGLLVPKTGLSDQLKAIDVDPAGIRWFIPTHAHVDHLGGYLDLPPIPVLLSAPERALIERGAEERLNEVVPAHAAAIVPHANTLDFASGPYETFPAHADLFGDGSVIVLPLPGHTPGSVGVLVTLPEGRRILHVGDAANDRKGIRKRWAKPKLLRWTDGDRPQAEETVAELHNLVEAAPKIELLPAHERSAYRKVFGAPSRACPRPIAGVDAPATSPAR